MWAWGWEERKPLEVRAGWISMGSRSTVPGSQKLACQALPVSYTGPQRSVGRFQGWELIPVDVKKLGSSIFLFSFLPL